MLYSSSLSLSFSSYDENSQSNSLGLPGGIQDSASGSIDKLKSLVT